MKAFVRVCLAVLVTALAIPASAQTPNTAAIVVAVVDQTGAVVPGAKVSITNTATGAVREVMSGADGSVTIPALSLTGEYKISVTKAGFVADDVTGLNLRAGETATSRQNVPHHARRHQRLRRAAVAIPGHALSLARDRA